MPGKKYAHIKNQDQYEALRDKGYKKSTAAKIANTSNKKIAQQHEGKPNSFDDWTKKQLVERAKDLDISGRSNMNKGELISALRNSR